MSSITLTENEHGHLIDAEKLHQAKPLAGRHVPDHITKGSRVVFVGASPSSWDAIRGRPLSGPVARCFLKSYLAPLGLGFGDVSIVNLVPIHLVHKNGRPREPSRVEVRKYQPDQLTASGAIVVALGKTASTALGKAADLWMPHPVTQRQYGGDEVIRKIAQLKKLLKAGRNRPSSTDTAKTDAKKSVAVVKADDERRISYGVVLEPLTVDLQNDAETAKEIEKAAHGYMANSQMVKEGHETSSTSTILECYIAPVEFSMGDQVIKQGSWILVEQHSPEVWKQIKAGAFNGYSIGGSGERIPVTI